MPSGSSSLESSAITLLGSRIYVTRNGRIIDLLTNEEIEQYQTKIGRVVDMPNVLFAKKPGSKTTVQVALLIALAFKRVNIPLRDLLTIEILFEDGDVNNITPNNLILKFPEGGIEHPFWPGFFYIPGFTSYLINREGKVLSLVEGKFKTVSMGSVGYPEISVTKDSGGSQSVGIHRLLGLAFLPYGNTVRKDVVNHMDLDKTNHDVSNLEWVSSKGNVLHARVMGAMGKSVALSLKDLYTGETTHFNSLKDCAKFHNCDKSLVWLALNNHAKKTIFKQRYVVKYHDMDWPNITVDDIKPQSLSGGRPVLVMEVSTRIVTRFDRAADFVRESGFSKKVVTSNLARGRQVLVNGHLFKYESNLEDWII